MKKRLLSALLALALVFVLLPTTALADTTPVTDENVKINGTAVIVGNDISLGEGNGTYSYDEATHTLTLNSATINATGSNIGISFGVPVKGNINYRIELEGKNTITSTSAQAIYVEHDTSVEAWEKDTMKRSTLTINGSAGSSLNLSVSGSKEAIEAIWSKGDFTLSGGTAVTAFSSGTIAVNVGSMTINNSKLSAQSSSYGTTVVLYGFEMIGDAAEFEALNTSSSVRAVLRTSGASENIDWSKYQLITGSYSGNALTKSEPTVCDKNTLNDLFSSSSTTRYIHIAKRTVPALETTSDVYIAGGPAVVGQWTNIPAAATGTGSYYYDADKKELTLKDVNITYSKGAIVQFMAGAPYIIKLEGTNSIKDVSSFIRVPERGYESLDGLSVTISGSGSLEVTARSNAINMEKGDLKFENTGEIKLTTSNISPTHNVLSVSGNITIADMEKYKVEGIVQDNTKDGGDTVTLSEASHLKGYQNPDGTAICLKTITITPTPAKDSTISYGKKTLKQGEIIKGEISGTATVATKGNTITLNNFKGTQALSFDATLADSTLVLEGTSTLSSIVTTQKGLTISGSGSGSLTVGSIRVPNNTTTSNSPSLTIDGAKVTAGTPTSTTRAVEVKGDLTVTNGSLTATSKSDSVPTVQVGGDASFTGSTVTITNNSTALHKDAAGSTKGDSVSSALYVKGNINTDNANVTAKVENGGGNAIGALGNITVNGSNVTAVNKGQKFTTIIAKNVYVSGDSKITANNLNENPVYNGSYLAFPAIEGNIVNQNTDYSLMFVGERNGSSEPETTLAPGEQTTLYYYNVTITRGDEVTPVVIAGTPLLNDTYYTITNGSTVVANGSKDNYNAFYDSKTKTLKLNNAQISHSFAHEYGDGTDGAIIFKEYKNYCIELSGTNTISSMNTYAINGDTNSLTIKNAAEAENAKLTLTSNWMVICSIGGLNIQSDVTMVNTKEAGYLMYVNDTFSFDGYNAYASVNASGSPLVEYTVPTSGDKDAGYQYLRITKETLETGGGSTHQHTYDQSAWKSDATHHWQECTDPNCPDPTKGITNKAPHSFSNGACTVCGYRGQTEEHHFSTDWTYDETHHWHACTDKGCDAISGKAPHEWTGWRIDEPSPGMHNRFCNCGYNDYSHHYNLVYAAAGEAGHYQYCTLGNCTFKTSTVPHNYDGDTCTICNYTKSGEIVPPTPDNPGTIVIIRPAEEEKPAQQPNPSTGANDLVGLAVAAAVAAALGSAALLRKHD